MSAKLSTDNKLYNMYTYNIYTFIIIYYNEFWNRFSTRYKQLLQ